MSCGCSEKCSYHQSQGSFSRPEGCLCKLRCLCFPSDIQYVTWFIINVRQNKARSSSKQRCASHSTLKEITHSLSFSLSLSLSVSVCVCLCVCVCETGAVIGMLSLWKFSSSRLAVGTLR